MDIAKRRSSFRESSKQSTSQIEASELSDIFINKGLLQEANRVFFNPLGYVLQLTDSHLTLEKSDNDAGPVMDTIDRMQLTAFRNYSTVRYNDRQKYYGFIIQTLDMLRSKRIIQPIASPSAQRLQLILKQIDQVTYECKQRVIENSSEKDKNLRALNKDDLTDKIKKAYQNENWINLINFVILMMNVDKINESMAEIKRSTPLDSSEETLQETVKELGITLPDNDPETLKRLKERGRRR